MTAEVIRQTFAFLLTPSDLSPGLTCRDKRSCRALQTGFKRIQTLVAVLSSVGVALSGLGIRYASNAGWIAVCLILLAAFSATPSLAARVNRLQQGRKAAEQCAKRLLHACGHSFGHPTNHVRVNIMKFSADAKRRKVEAATAFNMEKDPDLDLEIDAMAGVSGQAALIRRPAFSDISMPLQPGPGGVSSATTSPRSVTSTPSPARTWRRYSLSRFFSSRTPTVFMRSM